MVRNAAILGVFLENRIKSFFASPYEAAGFLVANGLLMLGFEVPYLDGEIGGTDDELEDCWTAYQLDDTVWVENAMWPPTRSVRPCEAPL